GPSSYPPNTGAMANSPGPMMAAEPTGPHYGVLQAPQGGGAAEASGLSSWIRYTRPCCCGPIGGRGPTFTPVYIPSGPSSPVGGGVLGFVLDTGWEFQGGGRSLFFNADMTSAFTADFGISYTYNHGNPNRTFQLDTAVNGAPAQRLQTVHLQRLHRTVATLALGKEWYLYVWPNDGPNWRAGFDVGGQLGTDRAEFREPVIVGTTQPLRPRNDMLWGVAPSFHTDLEIPRGCCTFMLGFRVEWAYQWTKIVQNPNHDDLQSLNLLVTTGFRY